MAPVTILVPSNLAGRTLGWALAQGVGGDHIGIAGIRITTLARLAEAVAAARLHPRRPLLPSILAAAWRSELETASTGSSEFAEVWRHPSTVASLTKAYRDLREVPTGESPTDLMGVPAETIRLARQVRERLVRDWYDQQDLFAAATGLAESSREVFAEFGSFIRYLEADESLSARAFMATLEQTIGVESVMENANPTVQRVLHASDSDDEVRVVVREVVAALGAGHHPRRLAIVYSRPDPYVRIIHAQLAAAGIEFNGRGGVAVAEMASCRAFLGMLQLPGRQFPRPRVFELLATWPLRQFGSGEPVGTVTWERISRRANVAGSEPIETGWVRRLNHFGAQDRNHHQAQDADLLRDFVVTLDARLRSLDAASTWEELCQGCLALLDELFGDVAEIKQWHADEKRAFVTLRSSLSNLRSLDVYRAPGGLEDLIEVLTANLEASIARTGRFGQGVFVGPIAQARGLDLDKAWVVGLSEDLYPGRQLEDSLLPDRLRAATPGLLSARDRVERLDRDLSAAFSAAAEVTASFPRGDLRASTEKLPSRLLLPSLRKLTGMPDLSATEWHSAPHVPEVIDCASFAAEVRGARHPATEQEWAMRAVTDAPDTFDDPCYRAARDLRIHRGSADFTRFDGNLSGQDGLPNLAAGEDEISPTALEKYATCPFGYFVSYLLRVKPVEEPSALDAVSPIEIGNIFHQAMDRFIQAEKSTRTLPGPGEPWLAAHHERLNRIADDVIAEFETQGLLGHPTLWGFAEPNVRRDLVQMLEADSTWRAENGAEPIDSELAFGDTLRYPAVEIQVPSGLVRFRGSADKVDRAGDLVIITDIKTGKVEPFRKISPKQKSATPNPTVDGTKLQLPIYARAALAANPGMARVQAQYWFVHGRSAGERVPLELTPELEQTFAGVVGTLVTGIGSGHFFKKPSKDPGYFWVDCEFCTPGGLGHAAARQGYLSKRSQNELFDLLGIIDPEGAQLIRDELGPRAGEVIA